MIKENIDYYTLVRDMMELPHEEFIKKLREALAEETEISDNGEKPYDHSLDSTSEACGLSSEVMEAKLDALVSYIQDKSTDSFSEVIEKAEKGNSKRELAFLTVSIASSSIRMQNKFTSLMLLMSKGK